MGVRVKGVGCRREGEKKKGEVQGNVTLLNGPAFLELNHNGCSECRQKVMNEVPVHLPVDSTIYHLGCPACGS